MVHKFSFSEYSPSLNDFCRKTATYYLTLLAKYKDWKKSLPEELKIPH